MFKSKIASLSRCLLSFSSLFNSLLTKRVYSCLISHFGVLGRRRPFSRQNRLSRFVHLQLGDDTLGRVDADLHGSAINFIPRHLIHVNHPLLPVHLHNLPFFPFERPSNDSHFVFFPHRNRSAVVLLLQLLAQRCGHDFTPLAGRRGEVRFARFAARGGHVWVEFHC